MKKIIYSTIIVALVTLASCSKDAKINKRIDGTWKVTTFEGDAVPTGDVITFEFSKSDKKEGTGSRKFTDEVGNSFGQDFTYTLADEKLSITTTSTFLGATTQVYDVVEYTKTKFKISDTVDGDITEMEKM